MALEREVPWCTVFLVIGALTCQTMVLKGNLDTAQAFAELGSSTTGWSNVGLSLSSSLSKELDFLMSNTSKVLNTAIGSIQQLHSHMDFSFGMSGGIVDDILERYRELRGNLTNKLGGGSLLQEKEEGEVLQQRVKLVVGAGRARLQLVPAAGAASPALVQQAASRSKAHATHTGAVLAARGRDPAAGFEAPMSPEAVRELLDAVWANVTDGNSAAPTPEEFKAKLKSTLGKVSAKLTGKVGDKLQAFLEHIRPALLQIGEWLESFSDSMQVKLEGFSSTLDKVQKIFDQLMSQMSQTAGSGLDVMLHETYTLFDTDEKGYVVADDLTTVADLYGLAALKGPKVGELCNKYDSPSDGRISKKEYALMVQDESIKSAMPTILRTYSKKLSVIAGQISAAKMRDEVAATVVDYFTLVCAKNISRVKWVSETLTNQTVPIEFTTAVLKNLADNEDNPNKLTNADVGAIIVDAMSDMNAKYVGDCLLLMTDPEFWHSEGFTPADQSKAVERVAKWVVKASRSEKVMESLPSKFSEEGEDGFATRLRDFTKARSERFAHRERLNRSASGGDYYSGASARSLKSSLLGGVAASAASADPAQRQALMRGQPAVPETLLFAKWLANNASENSKRLEREAFDYAGTSSSAMDNFVDQMQGMIKKMQSFLSTMEEYATPRGVERLEQMAENFTQKTSDDVLNVLMGYVDKALANVTEHGGGSLLQEQVHIEMNVTGLVGQLTTLLSTLQQMLPAVVDDLKFARKEVSAVSHTMHNVFTTFHEKGSPIFNTVSKYYATLWTAYFALFGGLTVAMLFYGFWASGWFGGPGAQGADGEDEHERPTTFRERCCATVGSCCTCLRACQDTSLCFWSAVLLMQVLVLVLFVVSIALCLLAGVKAFMSAGCGSVYVLADDTICTGVLGMLSRFLKTFFADNPTPLAQACNQETLLTCQVIGARLKSSTIMTTIGSLLAAVLSFQMIVESAVLHERARWRKIFDEESKAA